MQEGLYTIQMDKSPQRMKNIIKRGYRYPEGRIEVGKLDGKMIKFYEGMISRKKLMSKTYLWSKGRYVIFAKLKFDKDDEKK